MKFVIDRSKWRCGGEGEYCRGKGDVELLNLDGFMCCLGQIAIQLGAERGDILEWVAPCEVENLLNTFLCKEEGWMSRDSHIAEIAMKANDDENLTDGERESLLVDIFSGEDIEIEFTGEYSSG